MTVRTEQSPPIALIITTSGGGGHIQAARAKILEIGLEHKDSTIVVKDILLEAAGKYFGKKMIKIWDSSQRKGSVRTLEFWASAVPVFSIIFYVPVLFQILYLLFKHDINRVIDTQPLALPSIIHGMRIYNFFTGKHLILEKFLTEFPTDYAAHYLKPIKRLRQTSRKLIKLFSAPPLLKTHRSSKAFWKDYTGLSESSISYGSFPIRPTFQKFKDSHSESEAVELIVRLTSENEKKLLVPLLQKSWTTYQVKEDSILFKLLPEHRVSTLMLGSQPTQSATLKYVKKFIQLAKKDLNKKNHWLFVFCSKKRFEDVSLQTKIHNLIINNQNFPSNLNIIPMSAQEDSVIAPLFNRSDATVTRSGGVTAMELMTVAKGHIWIHRETSDSIFEKFLKNRSFFELYSYKGMPKWEYGNANYLEKEKGAQIITPETFEEASEEYLLNPS